MPQREQWNPIPSALYGVVFGALAGGLMVWGTYRGNEWQHQAATVVEISIMTALACVVVFFVRRFFLN
jgi:hypothetical protein